MLPSKTSILLAACLCATHESFAAYIDPSRRFKFGSQPHLFARNFTSGLDYFALGYNINITLSGKKFSVSIDSGRWVTTVLHQLRAPDSPPTLFPGRSSDLWVMGSVPNAIDTGASTSIQYADGSQKGMNAYSSQDEN